MYAANVIKDVNGGMGVVQKTKDKLSPAAQQDNERQQKGGWWSTEGMQFLSRK